MFLLILAVVLLIAGLILAVFLGSDGNKKTGITTGVVALALAIILVIISCIASVPTGQTGILTTFGRVEDYNLDSGFHFKAPWQRVVKMDNRVQKATVDLSCFSSDIQEVECKYTVNYQIDKDTAQEIYRTIGADYFDTVVFPNVADAVKTVMARYTAENLVGNRDKLSMDIEALLSTQLAMYNINVASTAIEDLDFTDEFTNAVEAKQVAVQNKLRAQTEQEQKTMEAEQEAERAKINAAAEAEVAKIAAQADLEVTKIQADAAEYAGLKEAAKNKAISEQLTNLLLQYYYIQQWNGVLPESYVGSDNVSAIIGMGDR